MTKEKATTESFLKKYHETRAIICDAGISIADKLEALSELSDTYTDLELTADNEHCTMAMSAFVQEAVMRLGFQANKQLAEAMEKVEACL